LNGLRVSEATSAHIEHMGLERGHWTLVITRKGGKDAPQGRSISRSANVARVRSSSERTGGGWTGTARAGSSAG